MASSSSSSSPRTWRYRVFTSFHGPDVRKTFLSHLRQRFNYNGITMFDDQKIERGQTIAPELIQAIRESRISIVVLSQNYASSSWCLDELVEILKCMEAIGQIVMTVFYRVDPSDVRKQTGDFGRVFKETCAHKTEEDRKRWSQALEAVGNIAGEHFLNWDNEAEMMEKIANDVSDKLNATPSGDFDGMVGLDSHLRKLEALLDLDNDEVKMVAITGPAGIGKTTIARALHSLLSNRFQLSCFVDNLRGNYHSGFDEYGLKLRLQKHLLAEILNQDGMRIGHLGAVKERLCDLKVLIILDDVNDIKQLEALANETTWFGPGSRIVVTTENKELLERHGTINNTYNVGFPSDEEALKILCRYAFRETSPRHGYGHLAYSVTWLCGKLPLGLRVVGSCLQGKNEDEWENVIRKLNTIIDRDIEDVLRVGYESLDEYEQTIFLHIVVFFNHSDGDLVKAMLADEKLAIEFSLKLLEKRSLIYISTNGEIVIHKLLQRVGMQAIQRQEPWERRILIDSHEICDVLENDKGSGVVSGISFDTTGTDEVIVSNRALRRMRNLQFLHVYNARNDRVHIPEEMEFPPSLRLLHWDAYPNKSLPLRLCLQNLVELNMQHSKLEMLWEEIQPLTNLKKMDLSYSRHLKKLPNLSNATNLEELRLSWCKSLVELPSSIENLHELVVLRMNGCSSLEVIPTHINLASLEKIGMEGCSRLRTFPDFSTNIKELHLSGCESLVEIPSSIGNLHKLEELKMNGCLQLRTFPDFSTNNKTLYLESTAVEESIQHWSRLSDIGISENGNLTQFSASVREIDLSDTDIEKIPDCIHGLRELRVLNLNFCRKLTSLPELPRSLRWLHAEECESLERVTSPLNTPNAELNFTNCFKLSGESQRLIIQGSYRGRGFAVFPGRAMPTSEFNHRAKGNSLTIPLSSASSSEFKACVLLSPSQLQHVEGCIYAFIRCIILDSDNKEIFRKYIFSNYKRIRTEHLCVFHDFMPEVSSEAKFEFRTGLKNYEISECGIRIMTDVERKKKRKIHR